MRKGRRKAFWALGIVLAGATAFARPPTPRSSETAIHLAFEVRWSASAMSEGAAIELSVNDGRITEARSWPGPGLIEPVAASDGSWKVAPSRSGRVRARVEAPLTASLIVKAGGKATIFPISSLLEAPQRNADVAAVEVRVERLPWDSIEVLLEGEGFVAPGASLVLGVSPNVLVPDATEVALRLSGQLRSVRGDEVLSLVDRSDVIPVNCPKPAIRPLSLKAPVLEGTYVLEVQANWEVISGTETTRIARWLRKKRSNFVSSATRRMLVVVHDPTRTPPLPLAATTATTAATIVDSIDLARVRGNRATASGRTPLAAGGVSWTIPETVLVESHTRDRLRGWIFRGNNAETVLAPVDTTGLAWTALGLKVARPGRPHRLSVSVAGGKPSALGVALVVPGAAGQRSRVLLDSCVSGPAATDRGAPVSFSWPIWPDSSEPVLVLFNRSGSGSVRLGTVELVELAVDPSPAPLVEVHPDLPRTLAVYLATPGALDRFGGTNDAGMNDPLVTARNLAAYLLHCGASTVVLSDELADRGRRRALEGQADEDATGPDRLDVTLRTLQRQGLSVVVDLSLEGTLPGLPPPDSREACAKGLVRVDSRGQADGPAYQPLRREVREAIGRRAMETIGPRKTHPNFRGLLIRIGPGATLPGGPDVGFDDVTYERFVRETFKPEDVASKPGLGTTEPNRLAARQQYLAGPGRMPWLAWRTKEIGELYTELTKSVQRTSPGAMVAVALPALDDGPAGEEARRADLAALSPTQAWKAVGVDLSTWPTDGGPIVLRTVGSSIDDLGHDLAISPELDEPVAARPGRGVLLLGSGEAIRTASAIPRLSTLPLADGPLGDEPMGHALAALDARWAVISGSAVAGQEERVRRFARVFRALPAPTESAPPTPRTASGAAVRSWTVGGKSYLSLTNDAPYTIVVDTTLTAPASAVVDDLGRGKTLDAKSNGSGKHLAVELAPFGVAAIRIGSPSVSASSFSTYLVGKRDLDVRAEAMSALLERPGIVVQTGPPNPGFEPSATRGPVAEIPTSARVNPTPVGWSAVGDPANTAAIDPERPRSGQGSLRLDARALPASVTAEPFAPPLGVPLTLKCWFRSTPAELPMRIWIEGQSAGKPVVRRADLSVHGDWSEFTISASDLPSGGLDNARVRFELLGIGRLWIDDLSLQGLGPSDSGDRRARRTLTAAVHAYREGRYADFARLAGSSWARRLGPLPSSASETETVLAPPLPPEPGGPIRTGDASGLSPNRRLR
jgi:hypothetical protein